MTIPSALVPTRSAESHPLTWRLRDDRQPVWLDEYRSKSGYQGAEKRLKAWLRMKSLIWLKTLA